MTQEERTERMAKKRKRKAAYVYGNYKAYYGYRIDQTMGEDPRLSIFRKEWFENRNCLDIGCNQGIITISIAKKFFCSSILGLDIDGSLIETAKWNLRRIAKTENTSIGSTKASESELPPKKHTLEKNTSASSFRALSERVSFRKENIVDSSNDCSEQYDTILCLSVTKWIHLNWGDNGLIILFMKIWKLLRPGGVLILEPQPWISYKKNRLVSEVAAMNFSTIILKPSCFQEILLDKIGFRTMEEVSTNLEGTIAGFNRPIYAFNK